MDIDIDMDEYVNELSQTPIFLITMIIKFISSHG